MLSLTNCSKNYGDKKVFENISFSLNKGEVVGLVGRNGAGKTTLLKSILGLVNLTEGKIVFEGDEKYTQNKTTMQTIGYLLDDKLFEDLTATENIYLMGLFEGKKFTTEEIISILTQVQLYEDGKKVKSFSFGMKQRLRLGIALSRNRKLLILDEPLVGLDIEGIGEFKKFIQEAVSAHQISVILSTHQLSEIEDIIDRYLILEAGKLEEKQSVIQSIYIIKILDSCSDEKVLDLKLDLDSFLNNKKIIFKNNQELIIYKEEDINTILKILYGQGLDLKIDKQTTMENEVLLDAY